MKFEIENLKLTNFQPDCLKKLDRNFLEKTGQGLQRDRGQLLRTPDPTIGTAPVLRKNFTLNWMRRA